MKEGGREGGREKRRRAVHPYWHATLGWLTPSSMFIKANVRSLGRISTMCE